MTAREHAKLADEFLEAAARDQVDPDILQWTVELAAAHALTALALARTENVIEAGR